MKPEVLQLPSWALASHDCVATRSSLLCRLRDVNDYASWHDFFDAYWRLIYNVARKGGLTDADAQDVVQETVISVARKMPEFRYDRSKGSFKQWLLLITRRRIQDHLRRVYRLPAALQTPLEELPGGAENVSATSFPEIEAVWDYEWKQSIMQSALSRVRQQANPKHYQVFDACVLQNLPAARVARMFGLNAAQVYLINHRVSRMLKRTAAELEDQMEDAGGR